MNKEKFYITTPIYYVNDQPHIGHAYTTIAVDVLTRFQKEQKKEAFFLTGTDEHGLKIQKKAEEKGKNPQEFVNEIVQVFKELWQKLNIKYDNFIQTTNEEHKKTVQKVLQILFDKGVIYKGEYEGLYCVGCEQFKNETDLVDGKCPDHNVVPEKIKEECYLLKMGGEIQSELIKKIKNNEFQIRPLRYKNEVLSFLEKQELKDLSISRKNVSWGIPLPFDKEHTTYVWVDALLNYLTGLGWNGDLENIPKLWPADMQIIGKDILRVHATIWPIILMHLDIEFPSQLFVHGHILSGGQKMSKTLGNTIKIDEMLEKFGTDGTRYLLLTAGIFGDDIDITIERMVEKYNADLANGLGNLLSRVITLVQKGNFQFSISNFQIISNDEILNLIEKLELNEALGNIWKVVKKDNQYIDDNKPWELVKNNQKKFEEVMNKLFKDLYFIAELLKPFMPETSEKIKKILETRQSEILFQRIK